MESFNVLERDKDIGEILGLFPELLVGRVEYRADIRLVDLKDTLQEEALGSDEILKGRDHLGVVSRLECRIAVLAPSAAINTITVSE